MPIHMERLQRAALLIHPDASGRHDGLVRDGQFVEALTVLSNLIAVEKLKQGLDLPAAAKHVKAQLRFIADGLFDVETLLERLVWQREMRTKGSLDEAAWARYAICDINMFHIEIRSLFDHVASTLHHLALKPGQVPGNSFEGLLNFVQSAKGKARTGAEVAQLVTSCDWFGDMREVRDGIVHRGAETSFFFDGDRLLFQTYEGLKGKIRFPEVMYNEAVVDFELYAGVIYGYLLDFLEGVGSLVLAWVWRQSSHGSGLMMHPGLKIAKEWIDRALRRSAPA